MKEKVKGNGNHVGSGGMDGVMTCLCHKGNVQEDLNGDGFDAVWGWIGFAITGELPA